MHALFAPDRSYQLPTLFYQQLGFLLKIVYLIDMASHAVVMHCITWGDLDSAGLPSNTSMKICTLKGFTDQPNIFLGLEYADFLPIVLKR